MTSQIDEKRMIRRLQRIISAKSYGGKEQEAASVMADMFAEMGLDVETYLTENDRPNVVGRLCGQGRGPAQLLYNGHMDTNPPGLGWSVDPFAGVVDEQFVYGLGVSNMKAGNIAFVEALESLIEQGWQPAKDVLVTQVVGELQGGLGTSELLRQGIYADYFVVGEPTDLSLLTMHAGSVELTITIRGQVRHLSKMEEGVHAVKNAAHVVLGLDASILDGRGLDAEQKKLLRLNVGSIYGGLTEECWDYRPALVPDYATINLATRIPPNRTEETVLRDVQRFLEDLGKRLPSLDCSVEIERERRIFMPPFRVGPEEDFVRLVAQQHYAFTQARLRSGAVEPYCFMGTDAGHLAAAGMTGVVYGPGGRYNTMPDERVDLADLLAAAHVYQRIIVGTNELVAKQEG